MINEIPESRTVRLTIRYISGGSDCFEFDSPQEEKAVLASHIQRVRELERVDARSWRSLAGDSDAKYTKD